MGASSRAMLMQKLQRGDGSCCWCCYAWLAYFRPVAVSVLEPVSSGVSHQLLSRPAATSHGCHGWVHARCVHNSEYPSVTAVGVSEGRFVAPDTLCIHSAPQVARLSAKSAARRDGDEFDAAWSSSNHIDAADGGP